MHTASDVHETRRAGLEPVLVYLLYAHLARGVLRGANRGAFDVQRAQYPAHTERVLARCRANGSCHVKRLDEAFSKHEYVLIL